MKELIAKYVRNGFVDFRGSFVSGEIVLTQALINDVLGEFLRTAAIPARSPSGEAEPTPLMDPKMIVGFVKKAEVTAEPGIVKINFELSI
jgi:hypothetical protein